MFVTMKEEKNTLKYQETMNVDIENIVSKKQPFWRSIYEIIDDSYFEVVKLFPTTFLNQCRNDPNEPQNIPSEVKEAFKNGFGTWVECTSGYDPPKGVRQ